MWKPAVSSLEATSTHNDSCYSYFRWRVKTVASCGSLKYVWFRQKLKNKNLMTILRNTFFSHKSIKVYMLHGIRPLKAKAPRFAAKFCELFFAIISKNNADHVCYCTISKHDHCSSLFVPLRTLSCFVVIS